MIQENTLTFHDY